MRQRETAPVLCVEGITKEYKRGRVTHTAVRNVSLRVESRRTLAVVGESGAGKTTLIRLIAGLETPTEGFVHVNGVPPRVHSGHPSPVQMVFQNPAEALNPFVSVEKSVAEPLRRRSMRERATRVVELLESVGMDPARRRERPDGFSGGQLQRIVIARALAAEPRLLLCDEPTSALDVSFQAQIVNLLLQLQATVGFACVLVTHDLGVARVLADEILVLRQGRSIEHADTMTFFASPQTEYSQRLVRAVSAQSIGV